MGTFAPPGVAADASGAIELPEFYRAIFDHAEFAVYVLRVDETGACTFDDANEGVERIAGRPIAEIRGRDPADCLPEEVAHCLGVQLGLAGPRDQLHAAGGG